ncbi:GNAT family N-acetyltransferase [Sphingomonas jatrophae]|uniref:N-acetyltransferase domain-containing protein n=1 Tax=Sphingomonas jatrophae TaxID=1166337 RepID=A0A1I6K593_9SPHN|nr:GNAT family N-acetyltransferase [Sphingomonas jatrophae]SFR86399.1 hypothetical protein SAMN05192580_1343 [Sphingomonas jatrophae]
MLGGPLDMIDDVDVPGPAAQVPADVLAAQPGFHAPERGLAERFTDRFRDLWDGRSLGMSIGRAVAPSLSPAYDPSGKLTLDQRIQLKRERLAAEERERRAQVDALDAADPAWKADGSLAGNLARSAADLLGAIVGDANPTYALGPGETLIGRMAAQAAINAGTDAAAQGLDLGAGVTDEYDVGRTALNFVAGGLIQGGGELAGAAARRAPQLGSKALAAFDAQVRAAFPERARSRDAASFGKALRRSIEAGTIDDRAVLAEVDRAFRPDSDNPTLTPSELEAAAVLRDDVELRESSPFDDTPDGAALHASRIEAMEEILDGAGDVAQLLPEPKAAELPIAAKLSSAIEGWAEKVITVESGGNPNARAKTSSASGLGQFTDSTWLASFKQHFGAGGRSDAQILALKTDARTARRMVQLVGEDYDRAFASAGVQSTDGNRYLAHFFGPEKAIRVIRSVTSAPDTPIERIVGEKAVAANRGLLSGKTTRDLVRWADRKMGGAGEAAAAAEPLPAPRVRTELLAEAREPVIATVPQSAAADDGLGPSSVLMFQAKTGEPGVSIVREGEDLATAVWRDESGQAQGAVQLALSAEAREIHEAILTYVRPDFRRQGIATKLYDALRAEGLPVERAAGAGDLTPDGAAFVNAWRGARGEIADAPSRTPGALAAGQDLGRPRARRKVERQGPVDLLTQIADRGGLRDDEGHALAKGMNLRRMIPGAGPLLRKAGQSVDDLGEWLWEQKWFGDRRPTEREVLELLEQASFGKVYHPAERELVREADRVSFADRAADPEYTAQRDQLAETMEAAWGTRFSDDEAAALLDATLAGESPDDAALAILNARSALADEDLALATPEAIEGGYAPNDYVPFADFDDPHGPGSLVQVESIGHDLAPLRDDAESDARFAVAGIEGEGGATPTYEELSSIWDELDAEDAAIAELRGCL